MPDVDIVITRSLSYATRRLQAGDRLSVSERDAKVLIGIGKAERVRDPGRIAAPPPALVAKVMEAAPVADPAPPAPTKKAAPHRKRTAKKTK